jgi:hypothetical protein
MSGRSRLLAPPMPRALFLRKCKPLWEHFHGTVLN